MDVMKFNLGRKFNLEKDLTIAPIFYLHVRIKIAFMRTKKQKSQNVSFGFSSVQRIELFSKQTLELLNSFVYPS